MVVQSSGLVPFLSLQHRQPFRQVEFTNTMPPPLLHHASATATLPQHCEPSSSFLAVVSSYLHTCIPTPLALVSSVLGTCSIASWLFAQLPQIYKNYCLQSTSGLSIYFLVEWCLGDTSNLVGALLTRQAGWQVVLAAYYVVVDITLVFQFFWYTHYQNRQVVYGEVAPPHHDGGAGGVLDGISVSEGANSVRHAASRESTKNSETKTWDYSIQGISTSSSSNSHVPVNHNEKHSSAPRRSITRAGSNSTPPPGLPSTRTLLVASMLCAVMANASPTERINQPQPPITHHNDNLELIGRIFSWLSTLLYLGSRPPQLYKNYTRKSTSGLSPLLFMAAFGGNFFYSISLLTNPFAWSDFPPYGGGGWADVHGSDRIDWISRSIPFFLGAFCVLFLDGFMGVQFLMYGEHDDPKPGRDRWTRVHGWMRGWIPSAIISSQRQQQPQQQQPSEESQALLGEERGRYGAV